MSPGLTASRSFAALGHLKTDEVEAPGLLGDIGIHELHELARWPALEGDRRKWAWVERKTKAWMVMP
jgi:hypothetical protein